MSFDGAKLIWLNGRMVAWEQATVHVMSDENGNVKEVTATAAGPVEASFSALEQVTGISLTLRHFELRSATVGDDALGEANVNAEFDGATFRGQGTSVDIVEAASRAYLEVINRILRRKERGLHGAPDRSDVNQALI